MSRYQVDSIEVAQAAARTRASTATIRAEVAAMMAHLVQLQGSWTGAAATAFAGCTEQWRATQTQVEASLEQITVALDAASQTYADAEASAQGLFAR
ncbi:WXG100 family type VII secretion target [Georgenia sp. TF02-10]|uniref:WXG100 family type VII secretion target n=1 Tax=Georgenia sp. TF02-10 TaxID=2917725 RepID=UPI001FA77F0F|nr:WXG100 family type VII secretion target [Georgenia sp. TF02-10]UNX55308.1 WXG100 family type VII secretion target [Georgenia sp. TF02-10]